MKNQNILLKFKLFVQNNLAMAIQISASLVGALVGAFFTDLYLTKTEGENKTDDLEEKLEEYTIRQVGELEGDVIALNGRIFDVTGDPQFSSEGPYGECIGHDVSYSFATDQFDYHALDYTCTYLDDNQKKVLEKVYEEFSQKYPTIGKLKKDQLTSPSVLASGPELYERMERKREFQDAARLCFQQNDKIEKVMLKIGGYVNYFNHIHKEKIKDIELIT